MWFWVDFCAELPTGLQTGMAVFVHNTPMTIDTVSLEATVVTPSPNWTIQFSGITSILYGSKAVNQFVGWIGGAVGRVLRTTNGGTLWNSVGGGSIGTQRVQSLDALDANTAVVTANSQTSASIYRTTNGGTSWSQVFSQLNGFLDAIHMYSPTSGIAIGDPVDGKWTILRTTDAGTTWSRIPTEPAHDASEFAWSAAFVGTTHIWFAASSNTIYRSIDGGQSWSIITTPFVFRSIWFNDTLNGIAAAGANISARSTDGGISWTAMAIPGAGEVTSVAGSRYSGFWAARGAEIYESTDQGITWDLSFAGGIGSTINYMSFTDVDPGITRGWAVSSVGGIASWFFDNTLVVDDRDPSLPGEITLNQNYPNPFNPTTTFSFRIPQASYVSLKVYDILGMEVQTLVDGRQGAGEYRLTFEGSSLASGVYIYRLIVNSNIATRKMLLVR